MSASSLRDLQWKLVEIVFYDESSIHRQFSSHLRCSSGGWSLATRSNADCAGSILRSAGPAIEGNGIAPRPARGGFVPGSSVKLDGVISRVKRGVRTIATATELIEADADNADCLPRA